MTIKKCKLCLIDNSKDCDKLVVKNIFYEKYSCGKIYLSYWFLMLILFACRQRALDKAFVIIPFADPFCSTLRLLSFT